MQEPFWSRPDVVERFAAREPDHRLRSLLDRWTGASPPRVLDLGCAGGRNTELLARAGADIYALDRSGPMVERTRARVADVLGPEAAERRVVAGTMTDLGRFPDGRFDWVVALGVYGSAPDRAAFDRALGETARVLVTGGLALVATFSPDSQPDGVPLTRVEDGRDVVLWRGGRRAVLLPPAELDRAFAAVGMTPETPTRTVRVPMEEGFRITINALYRRAP